MNISYLGKPKYPQSEINRTPENLIPNTKIEASISIDSLFERVKDDEDLKIFTEEVRAGKRLKQEAEGFIAAGVFTYRANDPAHISCMSGIICVDIDSYKAEQIKKAIEKGEELPLNALPEMAYLKSRLEQWPYTLAVHESFTKGNLSLFVKIPPIYDSYEGYARAIGAELFYKFRVVIDPSCQNPAFPKRISSDPNIYINKKSKEWTKLPKQKPVSFKTFNFDLSDDNFHYCIKQIKEKQIDICPDYDDWVQVMLCIADEFGKDGLDSFLVISEQHEGLNLSQRALTIKYNNACKLTAGKKGRKVSMKTFYWLCKKSGINIISNENELINNTCAKYLNDPIPTSRKVEKTINELKQKNVEIPKDDYKLESFIKNLAHKFSLSPEVFGATCFTPNLQIAIEKYVSNYSPCRNLLNSEMMINGTYNDDLQTYEDGQTMTDRDVNSMVGNCNAIFKKTGGLDKVIKTYLNSSKIPEVHPIKAFLNKEKSKRETYKTGLIDQLISCIHVNSDKEDLPFVRTVIRKWLLGLSQWRRKRKSSIVLAFTGEQGTRKTTWLSMLLPEELSYYFIICSFSDSPDFKRHKMDKLIILDDEFDAQNEKSDKLLKRMTSEQDFTHRPLYTERPLTIERSPIYAITSNPTEILNDMTGNRRILPLDIRCLDFEKFEKIDKTDLFIEIDEESKSAKETAFYLSKDEEKKLNEFSEDAMNYDSLYYYVKSCMRPLEEGDKRGAIYEDVFTEIKKNFKGNFRNNDLSQVLKRLAIKVDKKQSGGMLKFPYDKENPRFIYTTHNTRKRVVRAEFFRDLYELNGCWQQNLR